MYRYQNIVLFSGEYYCRGWQQDSTFVHRVMLMCLAGVDLAQLEFYSAENAGRVHYVMLMCLAGVDLAQLELYSAENAGHMGNLTCVKRKAIIQE